MDYTNLYDAYENELYTDIILILIDDNTKIKIKLHKLVLHYSCIYFRKLFTNFKEKDTDKIEINVPNAYATYDIIMSFYGQNTNIGNLPQWQHTLELIRCKDYLGLVIDPKILINMHVPEKGFELLLSIAGIMNYHEIVLRIIINNIPEKYDLHNFDQKMLDRIIKLESHQIAYVNIYNDIKICNAESDIVINTLQRSY